MPPEWKEHLRHVKGVYLLVDQETGDRDVGSAIGPESLWGGSSPISRRGTGAMSSCVASGPRPYRVSVLQIGSFDRDILELEQAWKEKLMTREFGLNAN